MQQWRLRCLAIDSKLKMPKKLKLTVDHQVPQHKVCEIVKTAKSMKLTAHSGCTGSRAPPAWDIHQRRFAVFSSTVTRAWRRYQETGIYCRKPGQGGRRTSTNNQDQYLLLCARRNRMRTARATNQPGVNVPDQTDFVKVACGPTSSSGPHAHCPALGSSYL